MKRGNLEHLFEKARTIETRITYEDTKHRLLDATLTLYGGVQMQGKGAGGLSAAKWGIISTIAVAVISTIFGVMALSETDNKPLFSKKTRLVQNKPRSEREMTVSNEIRENSIDEIPGLEETDCLSNQTQERTELSSSERVENEIKHTENFTQNDEKVTHEQREHTVQRFTVLKSTSFKELKEMERKTRKYGVRLKLESFLNADGAIEKISVIFELDDKGNTDQLAAASLYEIGKKSPLRLEWRVNPNGLVYGLNIDGKKWQANEGATTVEEKSAFERKIVHKIDRFTSEDKIQKDAEDSGIEMQYTLKEDGKGEIKKLEILLTKSNGSSDLVEKPFYSFKPRGTDLNFELVWYEDKRGIVTRIP